MQSPPPTGAPLRGTFDIDSVLKRDIFSTIERGTWYDREGRAMPAVRRRYSDVAWWVKPLARHFAKREARALRRAEGCGYTVPVYALEEGFLVRGWADGVPLQIARPVGERAFFASARASLTAIHRRGIVHNDLAKPQNWLRRPDGSALLMDFQLAICTSAGDESGRRRRRSKFFRVAAYEDIRHFLKQKRSFCPEALTLSEKRILARKSLVNRIWMATGKKIYVFVTRKLLNYHDTEGRGPRAMEQGPAIAIALAGAPGVREAHIADFPTPGKSFGLYAFVEAEPGAVLSADALRAHLASALPGQLPPEHIQIVEALPRDANGVVRDDLVRLVALNQIDQLAQLPQSDADRMVLEPIIRHRLNLTDRVRRGI
ncbi:serine/threonine protein kinase [Ancylobacter sp. 6x-1]|uniref:Serine/threonine protein kinase n=1 Tax=Ancylobacter crimeensis TaxID=2579147 RepID=A0ABT0D6J1_9HYPH|nr:serine/threonine protein kinase [Ancylobacter crimeensis]MCK0195566.1 serine/threonine protein kinase [Ancylobacter crimeensis]